MLVDVAVSQQWIESKGQFAAGLDRQADPLGGHDSTIMALHMNSTGFWVIVIVCNLKSKCERHALIFNFDERCTTLPEVQSMLDRISPKSMDAPKIRYTYLPVR